MSSFRKRAVPLLIAVVAAASTLGCAEDDSPLRLGINPWPGYEFLYLAQEKGFYRDEGLELRLLEFSSLSDARRAYERGQIDALCSTVIEVMQARGQSTRSPQIVQIVDSSNGADVILARPGVADVRGLRGARIGVELGSLGIYVLARSLELHGLGLADVVPVPHDQLSMEAAFLRNELDAVISYPPTSVNLQRDGKARKIFSTKELAGEVVDVISVDAETVARRPDDVSKMLRAYHRAIAYARENPTDAHRIMAAREGIGAAEFAEVLTNGVSMLAETDQATYLQPGGKLGPVIDAADRILRASGQLGGADRRADASTARFVDAGVRR